MYPVFCFLPLLPYIQEMPSFFTQIINAPLFIFSTNAGNQHIFVCLLYFRLLLLPLAFTAFGQSPHQDLLAPPATWVNILISMMLRNLLTTPSYPAWTYTYAMTVLQWMKVTWNDTLHALLIVLCLSESVSICMIISIRFVNNNMCSFYRWASPTWLARCHAADIQEAGFWLLSSPQAWWEQWLVLCLIQLQFSQRLFPSPTVTTVFSTSCLEDYCSSRLMACAIILCGIPQVCNVEQQADCCQWSKIRKIAFYFFYSGFKIVVFERYKQ